MDKKERRKNMNDKTSGSNKGIVGIIIAAVVVVAVIVLLLLRGCDTKEYKISFDVAGGSAVSSVTVKENETVTKPTDPTKEGYTFAGWYYEDKLFDFNTKVTKDMKLVAHWTEAEDGIVLEKTSLTLKLDETKTIDIKSLPEGVSEDDLVWTSSDETIATVDENGKVTAKKTGKVTITVKSKDGSYEAKCTITVSAEDKDVTGVSISGANRVQVGYRIQLTANVTPNDASNKKVTWKSSNPGVATVDANGVVVGVKAGTTTITVTTEDGNKTATYTVTVVAAGNTGNAGTTTPGGQSGNTPSKPQVEQVTVTFNSNGGSNVASQKVNKGAKATEPGKPTKAGLTFDGWYKDQACTQKYDFGSAVNENITLYAKWVGKYTYTVSEIDDPMGPTLQVQVHIFYGEEDVTEQFGRVFHGTSNLGAYSKTYKAILVKKTEQGLIDHIFDASTNQYIEITLKTN